jgi:phosphatidylserine decarboxylase
MTREGILFPLPFLILAAVFFILFSKFVIFPFIYVSAAFFFLTLIIMLFFRDPERRVPDGEKLILAPADGRIVKCDATAGLESLSIFLSMFDVHVTRSPVSGKVKSVTFRRGKFFAANKDEAQQANQRNEIEIETASGTLKMNQVAGAIARRTIFRPKKGQSVKAGDRVGIIRFGSRVDLMMPEGSRLDVHLKQKVVAGETILGRLP